MKFVAIPQRNRYKNTKNISRVLAQYLSQNFMAWNYSLRSISHLCCSILARQEWDEWDETKRNSCMQSRQGKKFLHWPSTHFAQISRRHARKHTVCKTSALWINVLLNFGLVNNHTWYKKNLSEACKLIHYWGAATIKGTWHYYDELWERHNKGQGLKITYRQRGHHSPSTENRKRSRSLSVEDKISQAEGVIKALKRHTDRGTCPETLQYRTRAKITADKDFKRAIKTNL